MAESLLDLDGVASYTGYSIRTLQRAVAAGALAWTGLRSAKRFNRAAVDAWLAAEAERGDPAAAKRPPTLTVPRCAAQERLRKRLEARQRRSVAS